MLKNFKMYYFLINKNMSFYDRIPYHKRPPVGDRCYITDTPDEQLIATMLCLSFTKVCSNCGCKSTPMWRKGWPIGWNEYTILCNACGLKYNNGQICLHCKYVWSKTSKCQCAQKLAQKSKPPIICVQPSKDNIVFL